MAAADYIIVGSGINGLTCAALLGKKGWRVIVLEREKTAGGCMRTEAITAPGYFHDVMAATFVLFITSPAFAKLGADLQRHGLEFCHTPHPTGVLLPDGRDLVLTMDRGENAARLNAVEEGEGDRFRADIGIVDRDAPFLFAMLGGALWTRSTAKLLAREAWRHGPRNLAARLGEAMQSGRTWLETRYRSELVRALFAPWVLHAGLGPENAFAGEIGRVIAFALEAAGAPIVKGGAGKAVAAFEALIREQSGAVRTGADVAEVVVSGGKANGVRLASDAEIEAARGVICSVTPTQLYERLLPKSAGDDASRERARDYRYGKGDMQIHYALRAPPRWRTPGLERVALLHLTPGLDGVSKAVNECERGMLPETPTICVGQPHALDPSRCPKGAGILWIQLPEAPRKIKGDAAGKIAIGAEGRWSEAIREVYVDRVEAIIANHIDGFRENVVARRAYSPADLEAMNINLVGGDPYGGASTIDQAFIWRPFANSVNYTTPIRGLYQIGASTHPGAGLSGGSGHALAERLA
jgi:phytoene dehydrogenase-like protein